MRIPDRSMLRLCHIGSPIMWHFETEKCEIGVDVDQLRCGPDGNWIILLPSHEPYSFTHMRRGMASPDSRHKVVVVDLKRLLACADRDTTDYVLGSVQDWPSGKVHGIREFLDPHEARVPEMPYVTFRARRCHTLLGLLGVDWEGVVSFRNGQHRARYLLYAGATCVPVEVHESEADLLERYCGMGGS